jgi:hypothetical protein
MQKTCMTSQFYVDYRGYLHFYTQNLGLIYFLSVYFKNRFRDITPVVTIPESYNLLKQGSRTNEISCLVFSGFLHGFKTTGNIHEISVPSCLKDGNKNQ